MILILIFGFLFGAFLQHANLNKYNTIAGMATLENLTVAKTIAFAIGLGAILINLEISLGLASYHIKPVLLGGVMLGGSSLVPEWQSLGIVLAPCPSPWVKARWMHSWASLAELPGRWYLPCCGPE